MNNVSVVTVTYNNAEGLDLTLNSLALVKEKPLEVVVIDGGSTDLTPQVIARYEGKLNIRFFSEKDDGIYDAMNKGHSLVLGDFVQYLNAGDTINGDPYSSVSESCLLPVILKSEEGRDFASGGFIIFGLSYNHQAIFFKQNHQKYDLKYKIAADLNLILSEFPNGIGMLTIVRAATVNYQYGGVSSVNRLKIDTEIFQILLKRKGILWATLFLINTCIKYLLPRKARRVIMAMKK